MSNKTKNEYLLLFRGPHWDQGLSPEEIQRLMGQVTAWFDGLQQTGKIKGAEALADQGRIISGRKGRAVADGPFVESKEAIGGYLLLRVDDLEEAVAIARTCPTVDHGITIEVRPVLEECPIFERARKQAALAMA